MRHTLDVSIESPQSGWMSLRLRDGARAFVAVMSHAPADSLAELMHGLTVLLSGDADVTVKWNAEPEEYDFDFKSRGESVELRVVHFPGHQRAKNSERVVFAFDGSVRELCLSFWRELRELRERRVADVFEQNWRRAFPERELRELTDAVNLFVQKSSTPAETL